MHVNLNVGKTAQRRRMEHFLLIIIKTRQNNVNPSPGNFHHGNSVVPGNVKGRLLALSKVPHLCCTGCRIAGCYMNAITGDVTHV